MNKKLTLGSLFDGSGGFPLGGLLADISPLWASEVEPFAIRVTTKRMPFVKHYGDISQMDGGKIEPVDIITFGSPCQDMSVAGKRSGLDGSRSCLFYEAVRIIKEMRSATNGKYPRYVVWENVPGAFSSNGGKDFKAVLDSLVSIVEETAEVPFPEKGEWAYADCYVGDGWSLAYRVLDAQYWGVPQRRRRIYLVADFGGGSACDVLFKSEGLSRYSAEGFRAWQRTANHTQERFGTPSVGFDGYNGSVDEKAATLGVNCGMSTGRNGVVLNDQGGNRMDVTEEVTCTLRAQAHHPPVIMDVFDNHGKDVRYTGPIEIAPTISATYGTGGNNQPFVVGKSWDGREVSPTLTKQNAGGNQRMPDKDNFNCVLQPYGISAKDSNAMKSSNPHSGIYAAKTSRTLDGNGGNPACNQGGIAVVCVDQGGGKSSCNVSVEKTPTLTCTHGGEPAVCVETPKGNKDPVYAMTTGSYQQVEEGRSPTLMARDYKDPNAVCYGIGRDTFNQGKNAKFSPTFEKELQPTMVAKGPGAIAYGFDQCADRDVGALFLEEKSKTLTNGTCPGYHNSVCKTDYTVRRLTPVECARLQGFPDWWCQNLETEKPTDEDVYYWYKVFETYRKLTGEGKPKTDKQIRKWLNSPHSDSAEYKLWGNGVALPCVFFVLSGIEYYAKNS